MNILSFTADVLLRNVETFLTWFLACLMLKLYAFPQKSRLTYYSMAIQILRWFNTNRAIVESTIKFNKSAARRLKTDWTIATLSFASQFPLSFFFYYIITFIMHCIFLKNCMIIVFVNAGDVETRYNLSFFYCSKHKKWNVQALFQLIRKNVYGKPLSHLFDNPT